MSDLKALRTATKRHLDRQRVAELLAYAGDEVTRDYRLKDNPSFSIRRDGLIKDFGSTGFTGDLIAYLHEIKGIGLKEATEWVAQALGVQHE